MNISSKYRGLLVSAFVLAVVVSACGGDTADTTAPSEETTETTAPSEETTPDTSADEESLHIDFTVAGDPAAESLVGLYALDQLEEKYGYTTEVIATPESSIQVEGVSTGEFTLGELPAATTMLSILEGSNIVIIGSEAGNNWTITAPSGVETCADLGGLRMGLHAVGSTGEGYYNFWAEQNCTEEERDAVEIVYVEGSASRVQALQVGELDAAMITRPEVPLVEDQGLEMMVNFGEVLEGRVLPWALGINKDFLEEHPEATQRFMEEVVQIQRMLRNDQDLIAELILEYFPDGFDEASASQAAEIAFENELFHTDGGLSILQSIDTITEFFIEGTGQLPPEASDRAEEFVNTEPVEAAIDALGPSS